MAVILRSESGDAVQVMTPGTVQNISVSGTSAQTSNAVSANLVRLISTTDCYVLFGSDPTATSSHMLLKANIAEYFSIVPGYKIAAIQVSGSGTLNVTEAG